MLDRPGPAGQRSAVEPEKSEAVATLDVPPPAPLPSPPKDAAPGDMADAEAAYGRGDFKRTFAIAPPLAEQGHAEAQFIVAKIYDGARGGMEQNLPEAFKWYRRAAEQGIARAQSNVGRIYSLGRDGIPVNLPNAAAWFAKASAAGDMDATYNLANLNYRGEIGKANVGKSNVAKARELFARVMNSNSPLAPQARTACDFIIAHHGQ